MVERSIVFRQANNSDVGAIADVDRQSWPSSLVTTAEQYAARVDVFPSGQLVAEMDQRVVAVASAQRITASFLRQAGHSYAEITDRGCCQRSHHPHGEIYQLINVGVLPEYRGNQLGRRLIDKQIVLATELSSSVIPLPSPVERILGFTRPASFHLNQDRTIDEYVGGRNPDGSLIDPVVAFHVDAGATIVNIVRDFRPEDDQACGHGVLIEYPINGQRATAHSSR